MDHEHDDAISRRIMLIRAIRKCQLERECREQEARLNGNDNNNWTTPGLKLKSYSLRLSDDGTDT
jgi:hypothetical protein